MVHDFQRARAIHAPNMLWRQSSPRKLFRRQRRSAAGRKAENDKINHPDDTNQYESRGQGVNIE